MKTRNLLIILVLTILTPAKMYAQGDKDWGDAPAPYPTELRGTPPDARGARHTIVTNILLGTRIDSEPDGQPHPLALGDDIDSVFPTAPPNDDEDGITFTSTLVAGTNATLDVVAGSLGGKLDAWIDFNADGDWNDAGEQIFTSQPVVAGTNSLSIAVPQPAALGPTFARFRISLAGGLSPDNAAPDGEVEDYRVDLYQPIPVPDILVTNLAINASNTVVTIKWNAQSNITYQMQSSTNLTTNVWVNAGPTVLGPANSQTNSLSTEVSKFYRITAPWTE